MDISLCKIDKVDVNHNTCYWYLNEQNLNLAEVGNIIDSTK